MINPLPLLEASFPLFSHLQIFKDMMLSSPFDELLEH
jgi:hypothetical protein